MEADLSCFKRVIGDALRARSGGASTREVVIAVSVLNRVFDFGRPERFRVL